MILLPNDSMQRMSWFNSEGSAYALFSLKSLCKKRYLVVEAGTRMFNDDLSESYSDQVKSS